MNLKTVSCLCMHMWAGARVFMSMCKPEGATLAVTLQVSSTLVLKTVSLAWNLPNSLFFLQYWSYGCPDYYHGFLGVKLSFLCFPYPSMTESPPQTTKLNI